MKKLILFFCLFLTGCDYIASIVGPTQSQLEENNHVESKAVGAGCRQSNRNLEDCFQLNEKSSKRGIVEGWKEMDQYMRDNNILPKLKDEDKPKQEIQKEVEIDKEKKKSKMKK